MSDPSSPAKDSPAPSWVNIKVPLESLHGQALTIEPLRVTPRTDNSSSASPRPARGLQPASPKLPVVPEPASLASMVATNTADGPVSTSTSSAEAVKQKLVYVGFAADIIHHGHINIIQVAAQLGRVIVGLLTDEAIKTYKRDTIIRWEDRKIVVEAISGVDEVVAQHTHDYSDNLKKYKPDFVVHGTDWRAGTQALVRQKCIDLIATWGGQLVEPEYTKDISTTDIIQQCYEYEKQRKDAHQVSLSPSEDYKVQFATQQFLEEFDQNRPLVYVGFATDLVHHGHIRILREAAKHGSVVVGLLTDDAVTSYRRKPIVSFEHRVKILQNIKYVTWVIPQFTLKYGPNLRALRPEFVVHGDDWKEGSQRAVRDEVIQVLSEWKGALVEPPSTSIDDLDRAIESTCYDRVVTKQQQQASKQASAVASEGAH